MSTNTVVLLILISIILFLVATDMLLTHKEQANEINIELCDRINILAFHLKEDMALNDCDSLYK